MVKNWYMMLKKYRPMIEDLKTKDQFYLDSEDDETVNFTNEFGSSVYFYKLEEYIAYKIIKDGGEFIWTP